MRWGWLVFCAACGGFADLEEEPRTPASTEDAPRTPTALTTADDQVVAPLEEPPATAAMDSFWIHEAQERATRPPLQRPKSISLGYIGDEPLSGGVTRGSPARTSYGRSGSTWHQYMRRGSWR